MNALIVIGFVSIRLSIWFAFKQKETAKDEITQSPHSWGFLFIALTHCRVIICRFGNISSSII
jgi:hypothetical protein